MYIIYFMPLTLRESRTSPTAFSMAEESNLASPSLVAIFNLQFLAGKSLYFMLQKYEGRHC